MSKTIGIRVSDETHRDLERRAASEGVSLSDYCRRAIYERVTYMQLRLAVEQAIEKFEDNWTQRLDSMEEEIRLLASKEDLTKAVNFLATKKA